MVQHGDGTRRQKKKHEANYHYKNNINTENKTKKTHTNRNIKLFTWKSIDCITKNA